MKYNYEYGLFSAAFYNSTQTLLDDPDSLATNGTLSLLSALYRYMTPTGPAPSTHEIATGMYVPNSYDQQASITMSYAATMNLYESVCGSGVESGFASALSSAFENIGDFFHIDGEVYAEETNCDNMDPFPRLGDLGTENYWAFS